MEYPKFFDEIEPIVLYDTLAQFVGVNSTGEITLSYLDIVKTAGHSCGTVAGAYLCAQMGLKALFPHTLPHRGEIQVEIQKSPTQENAGVVGCVLSNITGATTNYGFGGIPTGEYNRRSLLFYEAPITCDIQLTRLDTKDRVQLNYRPQRLVQPMKILMSAISPDASMEDKARFPERFQAMVETIFKEKEQLVDVVFIPYEEGDKA